LQQVAAGQQQGLQIGIAKPQNLYETAIEMMKEGGYKDGARFWTDPMKEPPPQPQKDPIVQAEEVKAQAAMQLEPMKLQAQAAIEDKKTQNNMQQAQMEANTTAELERFKIEKQAELERFKAQLAAEVELQKAQIAAGAQIRSAVKTQTGEDPNDEEVIANKQVEAQRVAQRDQSMADLAQAIAMLAHATQNPPDRAIVVKNGTKMAVSVPRQVQ
jgi:superfamily II RNA helicase